MQKEDLIEKRVLDVLSTSPRAIHRPLTKYCLTLLKVTAFEELFFSKQYCYFSEASSRLNLPRLFHVKNAKQALLENDVKRRQSMPHLRRTEGDHFALFTGQGLCALCTIKFLCLCLERKT
jgi:hypothetical protein